MHAHKGWVLQYSLSRDKWCSWRSVNILGGIGCYKTFVMWLLVQTLLHPEFNPLDGLLSLACSEVSCFISMRLLQFGQRAFEHHVGLLDNDSRDFRLLQPLMAVQVPRCLVNFDAWDVHQSCDNLAHARYLACILQGCFVGCTLFDPMCTKKLLRWQGNITIKLSLEHVTQPARMSNCNVKRNTPWYFHSNVNQLWRIDIIRGDSLAHLGSMVKTKNIKKQVWSVPSWNVPF